LPTLFSLLVLLAWWRGGEKAFIGKPYVDGNDR